MHKKGRSREIGRPKSQAAQNRTKFTTKLNKALLRTLRKMAFEKDKSTNVLIEEACYSYWKIKKK